MQQITVAGGNLFQIALQQLGDATQWTRIALANLSVLAPNGGVPGPVITGIVTLNIPQFDSSAGGGVYVPPTSN